MNAYGFMPSQLFGLLSKNAFNPNNDIGYNGNYAYNPTAPFFGAPTPLGTNCSAYKPVANYPNWLSTDNGNVDLRQVFLNCDTASGVFYQTVQWPSQSQCYATVSPITGSSVCFSTESLFYAQSGYFSTVVLIQWSNIFACKSRKVLSRHNTGIIDLFWIQQTYAAGSPY